MENKPLIVWQVEEILLRMECWEYMRKTPLLTPYLRLLLEDIALNALSPTNGEGE